jgi:hypothetical protein
MTEVEMLRAKVQRLEEALRIMIAHLEDSLDGAIGQGRDYKFVPGISDVELKPDGSYLLSQARAALAKPEETST